MAEASLTYVINTIDNFVRKEWGLRGSIEERITGLKSTHERISEFLRGADAHREQEGNQNQVRFQQLRDINHDIESVLNRYAYKNAAGIANPWYDRVSGMSHSIDKRIREIEKKLVKLNDYLSHPASVSTSAAHQQEITPLFTPEEEIVGVEGP